MNFSQNLQSYRKTLNLTQEEFAEKLEVTRQSVSKWESGATYPETEKLITMAKMFGCTLDDLMIGSATKTLATDKCNYDEHQTKFAKQISLGIFFILFGISLQILLDPKSELLSLAVLFSLITIAVVIFVSSGILHDLFVKKNPLIVDFYKEHEKDEAVKKFTISLSFGIALILIDIILLISLEELFPNKSDVPTSFFIFILSIAVPLIVHCSMIYSKYNINNYNKENISNSEMSTAIEKHLDKAVDCGFTCEDIENLKKESKADTFMGAIMLIATAIFLFCGFVFDIWHIAWIVFPIFAIIGAAITMLCKLSKK